jgi:hypothetical protein
MPDRRSGGAKYALGQRKPYCAATLFNSTAFILLIT